MNNLQLFRMYVMFTGKKIVAGYKTYAGYIAEDRPGDQEAHELYIEWHKWDELCWLTAVELARRLELSL